MLLIISVFSFILFMLLFLQAYNYFMADTMTVAERVAKLNEHNTAISQGTQGLIAPPKFNSWESSINNLNEYLNTRHWAQSMEQKLIQADLPLRVSEFVVFRVIAILLTMEVFWLLSNNLVIGIVGLALGYIVPLIVVNIRISRRLKKFNEQISDALALIANSLRSGYSFMQAIELVSREMQPPISIEFYRVLREINLGVRTDEAMQHMAERLNSADLDLVVTAVLIQRQIGGNLAEILDSIAKTIRERVKIHGHIKTLTAQGRISGLVVGLLPIALLGILSIINPGFTSPLFTQPIGRAMLLGAMVSEIIGILLIKNIVNIKV